MMSASRHELATIDVLIESKELIDCIFAIEALPPETKLKQKEDLLQSVNTVKNKEEVSNKLELKSLHMLICGLCKQAGITWAIGEIFQHP